MGSDNDRRMDKAIKVIVQQRSGNGGEEVKLVLHMQVGDG